MGGDITALEQRLVTTIAKNGAIPLSAYMDLCLSDPDHGYYQRQNPFGTDGDFITAPEISGLFGEMCGLYLAHMFELSGAPDRSAVIELGPGRGTLMQDMQHVWKHLMPDLVHCPVHLVETSGQLRTAQRTLLEGQVSWPITWHDTTATLPARPIFGIANEFFDALPIDQFIRRNGKWYERRVGLIDGGLGFVDGRQIAADDLQMPPDTSDNTIAELCPTGDRVVADLARHIACHGGAILIIDYGKKGKIGDSLQAVAEHKPVDIFHHPGLADLSHWVDFAALSCQARSAGCRLIGPVPQGRFLMRIGLATRAEQAATDADPQTRRSLLAAIDRLTSPAQMGEAFKVALLVPDGDGLPPGFDENES